MHEHRAHLRTCRSTAVLRIFYDIYIQMACSTVFFMRITVLGPIISISCNSASDFSATSPTVFQPRASNRWILSSVHPLGNNFDFLRTEIGKLKIPIS